MNLQFEDYQLDTKELSLSYQGTVIDIEPTVLKIIGYLVQNREKVVSREAIFLEVWQDRCVSDSALSNHIKNARKILGDDGNQQRMIKTIHRRGYQFVCKTEVSNSNIVMVMPFSNTKRNSENDYYGEAVANQVIASLSQLPAISIHSANLPYMRPSTNLEQFEVGLNDQVDLKLNWQLRYSFLT